ncbi:VENN motif pre-toxin domain-containing protein, partial [Ewingella allii]|uniref:VENN motif pre-toxin domain-containing protein n=1 Tax=Ewingella allii TaxID=3092550 RepID=UPI003797387A
VIRDKDKQTQNVADLSRDVEHANQTLSPIFDKEKEQRRLQEAQKIGSQVSDIARTQGDINGLNEAKKTHPGMSADELRKTDVYKAEMKKYGTGSALQQGIQAATAAIQGLAGGDMAKAIAGGSAPYLAEVIHKMTTDPVTGNVDRTANLMAHAVVNAALAAAQGNNAAAGAAGAVSGEMVGMIAQQMYGKKADELSETEKQTVSTLATLAAGLAGGLTGDSSADAVAGAQAGKKRLRIITLLSSVPEQRLVRKYLRVVKLSLILGSVLWSVLVSPHRRWKISQGRRKPMLCWQRCRAIRILSTICHRASVQLMRNGREIKA